MVAIRRAAFFFLSLMVLLGCQAQSTSPSPAATADLKTEIDRPTPTPTLAAEIQEPSLLRGPDQKLWAAGLITNLSDRTVDGIALQLEFLDQDGATLEQQMISPQPPLLPAAGSAHYLVGFQGQLEPASARISLQQYSLSARNPIEIEIEVDGIHATSGGGSRLLGRLRHSSADSLDLAGLSLIAQDEAAPSALPAQIIAPQQLPAGAASPWLAEFDTPVQQDQLSILGYGFSPDQRPPACQLELHPEPGFQSDPQGNLFFTGLLQNQGSLACRARVLLLTQLNGRSHDLIQLDSPIPLEPLEARPFGFQLGRLPSPATMEDLDLAVHRETELASRLNPVTLSLRLTSFENLGSRLFLRGQVANQGERAAAQPTVFAAVRSTQGELLTAAWLALSAPLNPGQSESFVLPLPITQDMDLGTAEFDLRALALIDESSP